MKKILFTLFALALPVLASADDFTDTNGIIYELGGKGSTKVAKVKGTTEALRATKVLEIPATVNNGTNTYTVTTICSGSLGHESKVYVNESDIVYKDGMPYYGGNYLNMTPSTRYYYFEYQTWNVLKVPATITTVEENACMMGSVTTLDVADLAAWCSINITSSSSGPSQMWTYITPQNFLVNGTKEQIWSFRVQSHRLATHFSLTIDALLLYLFLVACKR